VAVDWEWDSIEFLIQCCFKAGLPPDAWMMKETEVLKFQAIIFAEKEPNGEIKRHS
jgi:AMMECR1 domain-containing protein